MQRYMLKFLDVHGRIAGRFEFHCTDDREAELACEDMADSSAKILWCGERRVRDWPAGAALLVRPDHPSSTPA